MFDVTSVSTTYNIRKSLLLASFDPSEHIGEKLGCISIDSYDIEKEFLNLFEQLTEDVICAAKVVEKDAVKLQNASTKMEVSSKLKIRNSTIPHYYIDKSFRFNSCKKWMPTQSA